MLADSPLCAAALDYSKLKSIGIKFDVICDWRWMDEEKFWGAMANAGYLNSLVRNPDDLVALPSTLTYKDLPTEFAFQSGGSSFGDDPYRSLAGYSRHTTNSTCDELAPGDATCMRCFQRGCNATTGAAEPAWEFMWAYYFNVAIDHDLALWPSIPDYMTFLMAYQALPMRPVSGLLATDTAAWQLAANDLTTLCRAESTGSYELPVDTHFFQTTLPGFQLGWVPLVEDEMCVGGMCTNP